MKDEGDEANSRAQERNRKIKAWQMRAAQFMDGSRLTIIVRGHLYWAMDGGAAHLEGRGQATMIRNSFPLSALLGRPIRVFSDRNERERGLTAPQLAGVRLVSALFDGFLDGAELGSKLVTFRPGDQRSAYARTEYTAHGAPGSVPWLIHMSLPCLVFAPRETLVTYRGGTNVLTALQVAYCTTVFKPIVQRMGVEFDVDVDQSTGEVQMRTRPLEDTVRPITLCERGKVDSHQIHICCFVTASSPKHEAERMIVAAQSMIVDYLSKHEEQQVRIKEEIVLVDTVADGDHIGLIITATTTTGCIFGSYAHSKKGKFAEKVANKAAASILKNLEYGGCTDEYLQDELIIFMALAKGTSKIKTGPLSLHTKAAIFFTQHLTGAEFQVTQADTADTYYILCEGVGFIHVPPRHK